MALDIDYENDWSGEQRTDPSDGNTFVMRVLDYTDRGFVVGINDIMGGHNRWIDADEWVTWERTPRE